MKHSTAFAVFASFALGGCNGAYWGNLIVLAVSLGVFYGTLTLQRGTATRSQSELRVGPTAGGRTPSAEPRSSASARETA